MGMFKMEKPRRFNHQFFLWMNAKEASKLEGKAKRELGYASSQRTFLRKISVESSFKVPSI